MTSRWLDLTHGTIVFVISGLADIDIATNQSLRNTIKYLSEFGYTIHVFAAFPRKYPILLDPNSIFSEKVVFHRFPQILSPLYDLAKRIKDILGRPLRARNNGGSIRPESSVGYYDEYNFFGRMLFSLFFLLYFPIEAIRASYFYLRLRPHIFYGINGPGCALATFMSVLFRKPVIHRWHGSAYTEEDVRTMKSTLSGRLLLLDGGFAKGLSCDAVVMTNDGTRGDRVLRLFGVDGKKINFWINGLDTNELSLPSNWDALHFKRQQGISEYKVLLMVSRLVLWKRVDRGIHCIHRLVTQYDIKNVVLVLLGEGAERPHLENLAEKLGVARYIKFMGKVSHNEIARFYSITDVFLSLYDISNLCNPLLEAMYFGLPIVTIDDQSVERLLVSGYNAILVSRDEMEDQLPAKLKMLLEDQPILDSLGRNAQKTHREKIPSWRDRIYKEHELIQKILEARRESLL